MKVPVGHTAAPGIWFGECLLFRFQVHETGPGHGNVTESLQTLVTYRLASRL